MLFPQESGLGEVWPVDFPLTYEKLALYGFDPNATFLYADVDDLAHAPGTDHGGVHPSIVGPVILEPGIADNHLAVGGRARGFVRFGVR